MLRPERMACGVVLLNKSARTRWIVVLVLLVLAVVVVIALRRHRHAAPSATDPAQPVHTVAAGTRDVPVYLDAIGTVTPTHTVVVHAQVSGTLTSVRFAEGQAVHAGDVLATIDDRALRAQVQSAEGALQRDRALLDNARADLTRYRGLLGIGSTTRQQVDTQAAQVKQYEGTVTADQGSLDNLRVQLGYTKVVAPIDGIAGLRAVDVGNQVQPGDSDGIVTLTTVDPITVKFAVAEDDLGALANAVAKGAVPVGLYDRTGHERLAEGTVTALDNRVDASTGTVMVRASFTNPQHRLFPNQFVRARVRTEVLPHAMVVPTRAIQHGADSDYVYVDDAGHASLRRIRSGAVDGDDTVVLNAADDRAGEVLQPGDRVITDGADALDQGVPVRAVSSAEPARSASVR